MQNISKNCFYPPGPYKLTSSPPNLHSYFRQRRFLWAPMRMWAIPLKCIECNAPFWNIHQSKRGNWLDSKYHLIEGDYPCCSICMIPVCPWRVEILNCWIPHTETNLHLCQQHTLLLGWCHAPVRPGEVQVLHREEAWIPEMEGCHATNRCLPLDSSF